LPERDPPHRLREVLVEAEEDPEAVLAGQVRPAASAGIGDRDASRLAAETGKPVALKNRDGEAAFDQLVRGGETRNPSAEHDDV
jgi:hypothetical protein